MFNFDFLEKGLGIVSPPHYILLTDQISLSDYKVVNKVVTS